MSCYQWCKKMEEEAKDGDEAYVYFQLGQMWKQREGAPCND